MAQDPAPSSTTTDTSSIATPGQLLGTTRDYIPGPGTHVQAGTQIHASILGPIRREQPQQQAGGGTSAKATGPPKRLTRISAITAEGAQAQQQQQQQRRTTIWIERWQQTPTTTAPTATQTTPQASPLDLDRLPEVNSTVLCRVVRIAPRQATVAILVVGRTVLLGGGGEGWQGLIRVQDVRATEKDKVRIFESFRPGDIVRAVVISLGDQSNYYLSTASNDLGVIMATSEAGNAMYPVSWKEYRDPVTGLAESRKVAKPF